MTKEQAIQEVLAELKAMPREELLALLEKHKDGDIALMLQESGALEVLDREKKD